MKDQERAPFVLPLTFSVYDIAVAFGRGRSWAEGFLSALKDAGLVAAIKPGKYKFCWRKK